MINADDRALRAVKIKVLEKEIELYQGFRREALEQRDREQTKADDLQNEIAYKRRELAALLREEAA